MLWIQRALPLGLLFTAVLCVGAASFDAVSIKPAAPDAFGSSGADGRNGLLSLYNVSLRRCVRYAYGIPEPQVIGGPKWVDEISYDITAKAAEPFAEPELLTMLRPVLADRFRLMLHREMRTMAGYTLVVAKGGLRAKPSDPSSRSGANGGLGRLDVVGAPLSLLAIRLSNLLERPVVDKTGETRKFDFHLLWSPDRAPIGAEVAVSEGPSLFTALQEQLGLKLVSERVSAEVLVIDNAEPPSPN